MPLMFRRSLGLGLMLCCAALIVTASAQANSSADISAVTREILDRALAARNAQQSPLELSILETGLVAVGPDSADAHWLYRRLRQFHSDRGNLMLAMRAAEKQERTAATPAQRFFSLESLAGLRAGLGDRTGAQQALDRLLEVQRGLRATRTWARRGSLWQGMTAFAMSNVNFGAGHIAGGETNLISCIDSTQEFLRSNPQDLVAETYLSLCSGKLITTWVALGKLGEASALLANQKALIDRIAERSLRPVMAARLAMPFVRVAIEQGRNAEARRLATEAIDALLSSGAGDASNRVAKLRLQLAQIDMLEGRWAEALTLHEIRRDALSRAAEDRGKTGVSSPDYAYTLFRLGRHSEALTMLERINTSRSNMYDEQSLALWEARAFWGVVMAATGDRSKALAILRAAVPRMLALVNGERTSADAGVLRAARLNWIIDGYLQLLADVAENSNGSEAADTVEAAIDEGFRMADLGRGSSVQGALAAAASRSSPSDPALAELARREQDLQHQMASRVDALGDLLSRGRITEQDQIVADMRADLTRMRKEHASLRLALQRRFPVYASLLDPHPAGPREVQSALAAGEALISIYSGSERTLIWAVPSKGRVVFAIAPAGTPALNTAVAKLRRSLDPGDGSIDSVPPFDSAAAHLLYKALLAPVVTGWQGASQLIIVPHGQLGQLPFSVLLTEPWLDRNSAPKSLRFANLATAPWLIRSVAISQLPSALTLPLLRSPSARSAVRAEQAFIGFGDPLFSAATPVAAVNAPATLPATQTRTVLHRRSQAIKPGTHDVNTDNGANDAINFNLLASLPDTAEEITDVARVLGADLTHDVFLHQRASEYNVRNRDLTRYRVVMFATHGLLSGEMPGLYQPALALSNPTLTGEPMATDKAPGDGMLSMEEILGLRLNADWVVLSACNTASSNGKTDEAVSGLGRAFFYAGSKSLLLTQWPVETVSARLLTTETFRLQAQTPTASRAQILRLASLSVMGKATAEYSYAHPMFWAPYVLVGDGGRSNAEQ